MKTLVLLRLILGYFKGIRGFVFEPNGQNADVFGDNETGKTSLVDSFFWLFFGKDSQNKVEFGIKTLENGKPMRGLNHEVEGHFLLNGKRMTLRRVYKEVWTRKRGSTTEEFSGHTTDYFIDGVPTPKGEYDEFIATIIDEKTFKLLTNPVYFAEHITKEERLATLMAICGGITDEEVISGTKALKPLTDILDGRSIDNHKKVIAARRKAINGEMNDIPVRINEATKSLPDTEGLNESDLERQINVLNEQIAEKQGEIVRIKNGGEVAVKQKQISEIEGELQQIKNRLQGDTLDKVSAKRREESILRQEVDDVRYEIDTTEKRMLNASKFIQDRHAEADRLRNRFDTRNAEVFHGHQHDENCAACGQSLPADRIAEAARKAVEAFNLLKANDLEAIRRDGKAAVAEAERLEQENIAVQKKIDSLKVEWQSKRDQLKDATAELEELQSAVVKVEENAEYIKKRGEITRIRQEIESLQESCHAAIQSVEQEIADLRLDARNLQQDLAKFAIATETRKRIAGYEEQEKALAEEFERLEHELYLIEEFTRTKTEMLESKINSKFKITHFRLFKTQINGGLEECCDPMHKGVPYSEGLNQAARFNCGLDIINALSEHYQISVPILCDGMESVTKPLETVGQQVRLIVSEKDKKLRVEMQGKNMKEAV